ncbi:MAG TPA: multicopper oxidase domain-containing protein, partial [Rhodanobacteraceae bacterium]|nr:multicopper oxidase domain-containing protein [Rhodanobacteraceae bacterium]
MVFQAKTAAAQASRRRFVQGLALGGAAVALGFGRSLKAGNAPIDGGDAVLDGRDFTLSIGEMPVDFTGAPRVATVVNGRLPAPLLRWKQGDTVTLRVRNALSVTSSIHWHGLVVP